MIPGFSTAKLIGMAAGLFGAIAFVLLALHWKSTMTERGQQLATICAATRAASNLPKLDCKQVPQQIGFMGEAIGTLTTAVHKQNDAVAALGAESARQQQIATEARKQAVQRADAAEAVSQRLDASSRQKPPPGPCVPSSAVQDQWK